MENEKSPEELRWEYIQKQKKIEETQEIRRFRIAPPAHFGASPVETSQNIMKKPT